jgi:phage terminase large subunit GpA-like protein
MAKSELYRQLNSEADIVSRVHTPIDLPDEIYKQICAEMLQTKYVKGYAKSEWVKVRERNEALDTANLARGAAAHIGIDQFQERNWRALESLFATAAEDAEVTTETEPENDVSVVPVKTKLTRGRRIVVNKYLAR